MKDFKDGLRKGIPICLGYLAVSFAFGVFCASNNMTPIVGIFMSLTNLTSSGQFAGAQLIIKGAMYFEIAMTVLLINLRYSLMSISLSQHLAPGVRKRDKLLFGFGITDEVFAVAIKEKKPLTAKFMYGLIVLPIIGWTLGTTCGIFFSDYLPERIRVAFGISLYAMFIAIIMPDVKKHLSVFLVVVLAAGLQTMFYYIPYLNKVSLGFQIIIVTIIASVFGALVFPLKEDDENVVSSN